MKTGSKLTGKFKVLKRHLAVEVGSGTLPVLSTPSMISFMEGISTDLAQKFLTPDKTTVGIYLEVEHMRPCKRGVEVLIHAEITEASEKLVSFKIEAYSNDMLIGKAKHKRAVINRKEFEEKYKIHP